MSEIGKGLGNLYQHIENVRWSNSSNPFTSWNDNSQNPPGEGGPVNITPPSIPPPPVMPVNDDAAAKTRAKLMYAKKTMLSGRAATANPGAGGQADTLG